MGAGLVLMSGLVLADLSRWLGHGLAVLGVVALVGLNLVAPAAFVAARNIERVVDPTLVPPDGHSGLDAEYLAVLPDDAIPEMVDALPRLPAAEHGRVMTILRIRKVELASDPTYGSAFSWNLGRERARAALATLP
jgi:hypothetical protein